MRCFILGSVCCLVIAYIATIDGAVLQGENKEHEGLAEKLKLELRELLENKNKLDHDGNMQKHATNVNNDDKEDNKEREVQDNKLHHKLTKPRPDRRRLSPSGQQHHQRRQRQRQRGMQEPAMHNIAQHTRGMPADTNKHPSTLRKGSERRGLQNVRSNNDRSNPNKQRQRTSNIQGRSNNRMHRANNQRRREYVQKNQRKAFNKKSLDKKSYYYDDSYYFTDDYQNCLQAINENCWNNGTILSLDNTAYNCSVVYPELGYDYTCAWYYPYDDDYYYDWYDYYYGEQDWSGWNDYEDYYWTGYPGYDGYDSYDNYIEYNAGCSIPCEYLYDNEFYNCVANATENIGKKAEAGGQQCLSDALCEYQNLLIVVLEKGLWLYK